LEHLMLRFILQAVVTAVGLWLAAWIVPGVSFSSTGSLVAAAVILGLVNAIVRPIMVVLTLPLTLITFGLFLLIVNAAMIGLTAMFLGGFVVDGLWAGVGAAIVTGVVSWIAGSLFGGEER
jgi:putative membrane protein